MTNLTPHGQVPEALRLAHISDNPLPPEWPDMVAAAAELRRQHTRIAELEAQIEALSGVQALSAGPSDAEIDAQWRESVSKHEKTAAFVRDFARAVPAKWGAPQQEAQVPVAYVHVPHFTVEGKVRPVVSFEKYQQDYADGIYSTRIPLYTAPQPAPAPLSDDVVRDAARYRWLRATTNYVTSNGERIDVRNMPETWDVAIDAAIAAQGGKV